ncbi:DUF4440 domain-containing protein [Roseivirga seohaensis]|uniref:nuclear transport factor 2 family protein n=1 Tax=Roseivirga seohaensis TaxID=1914963 RepID=UPI003BA9C1EB
MIQNQFTKTTKGCYTLLLSVIIFLFSSSELRAQSIPNNQDELKQVILHFDSLFWESYNTCDVKNMGKLLTDDIEFYHDKNGLTTSKRGLLESISSGLCANENSKLRRAAVEGSVKVYPMNNYGAIILGEHIFYVNETGKDEYAEGKALFTHLWKFENGKWKMARIISYDHKSIPYANTKAAVTVSYKLLTEYAGQYNAPQTGMVTITKKENSLEMSAGSMQIVLKPQNDHLFFHEQSSLTFEFVKDVNNKVVKLIVRENGAIAEEATRIN